MWYSPSIVLTLAGSPLRLSSDNTEQRQDLGKTILRYNYSKYILFELRYP